MRTRELLVGGAEKLRRRRRDSRADEVPPPLVGVRFIGVVATVAAVFFALALWRVETVFTIRDNEIETRRLQELTQKRHDRTKALESRISQLQRMEVLRAAAENSLGMVEPESAQIETLVISRETQARWNAAAASIQTSNERKEDL